MGTRRVWILNLDADLELARPAGYHARAAVAEQVERSIPRAMGLLSPGDLLLRSKADMQLAARGLRGRAFCPTPRALQRLTAVGALLPAHPALHVLRRVNHRAFCAELGQELPNADFLTTEESLRAHIMQADQGHGWLLKRGFGVAGRGQRRISAGAFTAADRDWINASLRVDGDQESLTSGVQIEPRVEILREFVVHALLTRRSRLALAPPMKQVCDAAGAWQATLPASEGELSAQERSALIDAAQRAGRALSTAGYFGPFAIDGYAWRDREGCTQLNALSEINARFTMGWRATHLRRERR